MKTKLKLYLITLLSVSFILSGCEEEEFFFYDDVPPDPPTNIVSVTGDNRVDLIWDNNSEGDLAGYNIYFNFTYEGKYTLIGSTKENYFIDFEAENGVTYYYAVAAYDFNSNESELSYDVVYDTPRPEGFDQAIFDFLKFPTISGYCFSEYLVTDFNDIKTDFFFENYQGTYYLNVWEDTDIQDMGETENIYDVSYAPTNGWVEINEGENVKYLQVTIGHTYVVWTWNNHYAKIRIKNITSQRMVFDWAYQLVEGNRELKTVAGKNDRDKMPEIIFNGR